MPQPAPPKEALPLQPLASAPLADDGFLPPYAELHCRSNFSFLVGASHPGELVARAAQRGYSAIAITDECSVAGVVRAHEEARRQREAGSPIRLLIGSHFDLQAAGDVPATTLVLIARNREGYGDLCELITQGRLSAPKGQYSLTVNDLPTMPNCHALLIPRRVGHAQDLLRQAAWVSSHFGITNAAIAVERLLDAEEPALVHSAEAAADATGLALVAAGGVLMHRRSRKALQDTLTAVRLKRAVADCGFDLAPNAEAHLRSRLRLAQLYKPAWLAETQRIAAACNFSLDELHYEYPQEIVPAGETPTSHLRALTEAGARERYPQGAPPAVRATIEKELALIAELAYEPFFLTVHDVVRHARSVGILCQGRGSAANSVVCYCLGITAMRPENSSPLFERFISRERKEPPDIDVDFEHERREEVIQYIYTKYGTHRTALAAALATYRTRGAVRDVGKALGFDAAQIDAFAQAFQWYDDRGRMVERLAEAGLAADAPAVQRWIELVGQLRGTPRHLSQHVGGFVIAQDKLSRLVPIENAAMADRRVIQWDKDDLESLQLIKVDVLALGMLTMLRRSLDFLRRWRGRDWGLYDIPAEDPATYEMVCRADTVGVFQIESRAQMSMLPRLQPREFYDLVIEVAIVRPGPIQGGMVHPYLKNRALKREGRLPAPRYPALHAALERTLGVPIFQEQVMQICMIGAGFTAGQADRLRRAMAAWKRHGDVMPFHRPIVEGMVARGYDEAFAEGIFEQVKGFGSYGFPESHAYSFALLAYFSAWIKCHEPAIFLAALLNSQPMGFYAPAQLVQDARRHGVEVRAVDVSASDWDCTLEPRSDRRPDSDQPAVRLGLRMVGSLRADAAARIAAARAAAPFADLDDLTRRASLDARDLQALARADALSSLAGARRQQFWAAAGRQRGRGLLADAPLPDAVAPQLKHAPEGEEIVLDYAATGLTLRRHPLALLRQRLAHLGWRSAEQLKQVRNGRPARACGIVTMRQRPETAQGVIFVTLEDETGSVNVIVQLRVQETHRQALLRSRLLGVTGDWQVSPEGVAHLLARELDDLSPWLGALAAPSRDFH
jgi:error-prone DNA polymerase